MRDLRPAHLIVDEQYNIIRTDIPGFKASGHWKFKGLVKRLNNGPYGYSEDWAVAKIADKTMPPLIYKNGTPKFLIADLDHGTYRHQGDGVVRAWVQ